MFLFMGSEDDLGDGFAEGGELRPGVSPHPTKRPYRRRVTVLIVRIELSFVEAAPHIGLES